MTIIPDDLIDNDSVAKLLGVKPKTLAVWRGRKKGPPYYRLGSGIWYSEAELQIWIDKNKQDPEGVLEEEK